MEHDGLDKLRAYLGGLAGGSCMLPFERMRELTGCGLPEAATSSAWWTDTDGWPAWPASGACWTAGWRLESVHAAARLVRLERIGDDAAGDQGGRGQGVVLAGGSGIGDEGRGRLGHALSTPVNDTGRRPVGATAPPGARRRERGRTMRGADVPLTGGASRAVIDPGPGGREDEGAADADDPAEPR